MSNCNPAGGICNIIGATDNDDTAGCTQGIDIILGTYQAVDVSPGDFACDPLTQANNKDEIRIDLRLTLPEDISPTVAPVVNNLVADITSN